MLIRFIKWFQGYLFIVLRGYSPERFINLCRNKQILVWDLRKIEGGYGFYISVKGFKQLPPVAYKTKTVPFIVKRVGLPFYLYRYRKRKVFFISLFLFVAIIYTCSLYIWNINVSGQYFHTEESIVKFINGLGTYPGMKKSRVDCKGIEDAIRKEYPDIGWVSAELRGTRLMIKLTETNMPVPKTNTSKDSHIIASHDGIVTSIITRSGTPLVKEGDVVKKGDILVSGVLDILDDSKTVIRKEAVIADADVYLKTYYEYYHEIDLQYKEKEFTGKKSTMVGISIIGKNIFFYNILKKIETFKKYDIIVNELSPKITENFYLPITFYRKTYKEYNEVTKTYGKEEVKRMASGEFTKYLNQLKEEGIEILEHSVKLSFTKDQCKAGGKVAVLERQTEYKEVTENEWRVTKPDESDGEER